MFAQAPTAWQLVDDGDVPALINENSTLVFDEGRGIPMQLRISSRSSVWELHGDDWVWKPTDTDLPYGLPCVTYDKTRDVVVMFGGFDQTYLDETWEFDGSQWTQRFPVQSPPPRTQCSITFDEQNQVSVLFGGYVGPFLGSNDTWEWDGNNWIEIDTRTDPFIRGEASIAYDPIHEEVVLFGGRTGAQVTPDTWVYDGRNWKQKSTALEPSARASAGFEFLPSTGTIILFGGATPSQPFNDTWAWDGNTWTELSPPTSPQARETKMIYDSVRAKLLVHGGQAGGGGFNDTWVFDGQNWEEIAISDLPPPRQNHRIAYDPIRDIVLLNGGNTLSSSGRHSISDTWELSENEWNEIVGAGAPSAERNFQIAFSHQSQDIIGWSGQDFGTGNATIEDIHRYDSNLYLWSSIPDQGPTPRQDHSWVDTPSFGGVLMFGGVRPQQGVTNETWLYDDSISGSEWQLLTVSGPSPRANAALSYHESLSAVILYGGNLDGQPDEDDTWMFDGQNWTLLQNPSPPGVRAFYFSMAYDASRDRTVLFGDGPTGEGVTWEFDGLQWISMPTPFQPEPTRIQTTLTYDSNRQVIWLFGGESGAVYNDLWAYGADPDEDGIVGLLDNCVNTANSDQLNTDGDKAGDGCDCATSNPDAFASPGLITGTEWSSNELFFWDDPVDEIGSGRTFDVVRGDLSILRATGSTLGATCFDPELANTSSSDVTVPVAGNGLYYLVRTVNVCGVGSFGRLDLDNLGLCP